MFNIIAASFIGCFILERIFAGWKLPQVHSWYTRVILVNVVQLGIVVLAGYSWEKWLSSASVFNLSGTTSPWLAGFTAYFVATFVFYWWHRLRHESDFFWRYFHQIHHSPQRLEVITSFYKHPLEMTVNSILGSLIVYTLLGLDIQAGAIYTLFTALGEFFYHTNMKSPRWVGYIFQRPEMHRIHHQYNYHKNNYGDFVIWDMIFGTFENPKNWSDACGFDEPKELRLKEMLMFKDVHKSKGSSAPAAYKVAVDILKEGDIIFLDIPATLFRQVAKSTQSWTSHVGIAFLNEKGEWIVSESKIPFSKETPLKEYIQRSADSRFEIRRLQRPLEKSEIEQMRVKAKSLLGHWYDLGFNFDSKRLYCSKFVYSVYETIGVTVGKVQTFRELLDENPDSATSFWRTWYLGFIPWKRRTLTPASQLMDPQFITVEK